jgi:OmpA family protein/PEGA domain-containing protein
MLSRVEVRSTALILFGVLLCALPTLGQKMVEDGKLKIHVSPKQAYVFVDGKAIRDGGQTISLTKGEHEVEVRNYGYTPMTKAVEISADKTTDLNVSLQASGDSVAGPFGDIEFKGDPRAAVLLNGKTPEYFVGHVDEFDWNWIWHQRLLVHPGTYQVTVTREGNTVWSGPVTVKAGQQVTVHLNQNGNIDTKDWPEGLKMGPQPRFHAGIASATVPVAPVTAQMSAQTTQLDCGQSTNVTWDAKDAASVTITNIGNVPASGDRSVSPTKTTTYELVASGPGGEATKTETIGVNGEPAATLALSQTDVQYHKIGDKVVQDGTATLTWSTANASKVMLDPLGATAASGSEMIQAKPTETTLGPIHDDVAYTIKASNACGGTATRTVMLHINGSIDPPPAIRLASVFYPTNYPTKKEDRAGLVGSEEKTLAEAAKHFDNYSEYKDKATLVVVGHADVRGSEKYNMALSQRRAELVKDYLVSQGVPPEEIQTRAVGKDQELSDEQVATLQKEDKEKPDAQMERSERIMWLAYNRRVDIVVEPTGQKSEVEYPNDAADSAILWELKEPSLTKVESAAKLPGSQGNLRAGGATN